MKKIVFFLITFYCLISLNTSAQDLKGSQWKVVDSLNAKGLTKSALDKVHFIYERSKKTNDQPQLIKSLLYTISLNQNLSEKANTKNIELIDKELHQSSEPVRCILSSLEAEMYWDFFQQNRYKFYNRTTTQNFNKNDIETWGIVDFHKKIGQLYLSSIKDESLLQQIKIDTFDPIIIKGNTRNLRPTLYDLLAHRALNYFKNNEQDITRPTYAFEINDPISFAPAKEFIAHKFINADSLSLHYKAITIYQKLLHFHNNDNIPDALIDADIERLQFMDQYSVLENKEKLYINALKNIYEYYSSAQSSAQAGFLMAQIIFNNSLAKKLTDDSSFYSIQKAKDLLEGIISKYSDSEGGINASNLLKQILHKDLSLTTEKVNIPGEPFRTLVNYKNIAKIYLKVIPVSEQIRKQNLQNVNEIEKWKLINELTALKSWEQNLPLPNDFQNHSTEIKIDALPVGEYIIIASGSSDFNLDKNPLAGQYVYVSNISYINSANEYFILNRKTGIPLVGAQVKVHESNYDYSGNKQINIKSTLFTSDKNGYLKIPIVKNENHSIRLEVNFNNDHLYLNDQENLYNRNSENDYSPDSNPKEFESDNTRMYLFTDRSIYRPGQIVYFKGIGVTKDFKTKRSKLLPLNSKVTILFKDSNGQEIDSLKLSLNEFGSVNGKFKIPENKLNGQFSLEADEFFNSIKGFSVEEYKRPKFYSQIDKLSGTYHLNDMIKITGNAKAYAGNIIDGAVVKYNVTRQTRFLYDWMWYYRPHPSTEKMEIAHGETKTNFEGRFDFNFMAFPDLKVSKNSDPVFDYYVHVDITDINGETRSAELVIPIGYSSLKLNIAINTNEKFNKDSLKGLFINAENLSHVKVKTNIDLKIYSLKTPERLIRSRYWKHPDQYAMSKEEFIKYFPLDEYDDELDMKTWTRSALIVQTKDTSNTFFKISPAKLKQGWYVAEAASTDSAGVETKDIKYFQVYDMNKNDLPSPQYSWNAILKNEVLPGDKANFISGTSADHVFIIQQVERPSENKSVNKFNFFSLNNEKKNQIFPVSDNDRGKFGITQIFVKDNRFYETNWNVIIPWNNKLLNIDFQTFRDKTLPGSEEKWKVKITGNEGQKVSAELLAAMYDASLDQFKPHYWNGFDLWNIELLNKNQWSGYQNFTNINSFQKWWNERYFNNKNKTYDRLINVSQNSIQIRGRLSGISMDSKAPVPANEELQNVVVTGYGISKSKNITGSKSEIKTNTSVADPSQIQIRKNFNETAFFYPDLRTDSSGNIEFNFTMPEAVTQWKLMALAHTKDLASGYAEKTVVTQKELMVQPNAPRFLREGDHITLNTKIVNLSDKIISGEVQLQLLDAITMLPIDDLFKNVESRKQYSIEKGQSTAAEFNIIVPENFNDPVTYRFMARSGNISDGEENTIPVLSNRLLVTETLPLHMSGNGTKQFKFEKISTAGKSSTLKNKGLTIEYTTNPAWYVIQALPYLMEFPHECAEQTFNRFYANSLAAKIANASPKIREVFEKWKITDTTILQSNLQKNQELKSIILEQTPWVMEAINETQQKKNIALLFDMIKMANEETMALNKLKEMQFSNGSFPWFKGGREDQYITQYILTGIGHLKKLNALSTEQLNNFKSIISIALPYLDKKIKIAYDILIQNKTDLKTDHLNYNDIQYLYMRSFFPEYPVSKENQVAYNDLQDQSIKYWLSKNNYAKGMIALSLFRTGHPSIAKDIIRSLKENAIVNEELGMYWKEMNYYGYWWYQAPIETQALMIEAFSDIDHDPKTIGSLNTWLLKNKQVNNWKTTKATAEACYSLLLQGTNWLTLENKVSIRSGNTIVTNIDHTSDGLGYFKEKIEADKMTPGSDVFTVTVSPDSLTKKESVSVPSWGEVYWQYLENLDKITFSETPLKLSKKLFVESATDRGAIISPVSNNTLLKVGDKIKVRIELRVDRDMEYIHMKNMRASDLEPINIISGYQYQGGLGYYQSTKDASTDFFFDHLMKGTYVFEYPLLVTHKGNFSNGITTIQCMYAPEFTAHSEGVRIEVK